MREIHEMELHLVQQQRSQAAFKDLITKHAVDTDTEGSDQELQPSGHSMDSCTLLQIVPPIGAHTVSLNKHC